MYIPTQYYYNWLFELLYKIWFIIDKATFVAVKQYNSNCILKNVLLVYSDVQLIGSNHILASFLTKQIGVDQREAEWFYKFEKLNSLK